MVFYQRLLQRTPTFQSSSVVLTLLLTDAEHNKTIGIFTHWKPHGAGGAVGLPDAYMDGVLRHVDRVFNFDAFHRDARAGRLPQFSYFLPPGNMSDHPCNDVRHGEALLKDVYESLRAGPGWNRTMLLVTYDDAGLLLIVGRNCHLTVYCISHTADAVTVSLP